MAINVCQKLRQLYCPECNNDSVAKCRKCWVEAICDLIEISQADKWIPVVERLPDADKKVLVITASGSFKVARCNFYKNGTEVNWATNDGLGEKAITHWMPLPDPPKEVHADE